ncbi:MAG: T9SS type A sorting domain-containing protein [Bacteroidia bacterium]|nr:T9SS type A sorting domain-containing protein [Bacteroidia bacterium]
MKYNYLKLLFALLLYSTQIAAQENIIPLKNNAVLNTASKSIAHSTQKISAFTDTLVLPLVDDFSFESIYPNQAIWCDSNVYINSDFPIDPISIGVATFDGLDKNGNAYNTSGSGVAGLADYLTSQPINLFEDDNSNLYLPSDSIFLTFFVQQGGLGEAPDTGDSLYVEFFNPDDSSWTWQWGMKGDFETDFEKYKITIVDTAYYKNGFQFRFANVGNLSGNLDHWHIDFVRLKRNIFLAQDTVIDDICYVEKVKTLLKGFTSIPYSHYQALAPNQDSIVVDTVSLRIRNNVDALKLVNAKVDNIYDELGTQLFNNAVGANNINPLEDLTYDFTLTPFAFPITQPGDSASFQMVNHIDVGSGILVLDNDTIRYTQEFFDHYAYDDGTAEAGYFLSSAFSELAVSFDLLKPDTLRGVSIHFSQINDNVSNERFTMKVWKSLGVGGSGDSVIYQRINFKPEYEDVINGFHYYEFDTLLAVSGRIYVGFQQITSAHLNLGLDLNMNANGKMFFNTQGTWNVSQVQGAWMLRPVFGDTLLYSGIENNNLNEINFAIYPNPAHSSFKINAKVNSNETHLVEVYNLLGGLVIKTLYDENEIDVSGLDAGIYFVRLRNDSTGAHTSKKLVITR